MKATKFTISFILVLIANLSWGQAIMNIPLRSVFFNEAIAANNIRSVVVFADLYEEGEEYPGGVNGKITEVEFDSRGYKCYQRRINDLADLPFLTFGSSDRLEEFYFDDDGVFRYLYRENEEGSYQYIEELDEQGDRVQLVVLSDDQIQMNHHFIWENGEMIEFEDLSVSTAINNQYTYNNRGEVTEIVGENFRIFFGYDKIGDTIYYTETLIDDGDTVLVDSARYHADFEHKYNRYKSYNDRGELTVDMTVEYDKQGNATHYDLINRGDRRSTQVKKEEEHYRIENVYDDRNLLVSRKFYSIVDESALLVRVERYIYSTQGLDFKIKKCDLLENRYRY